MEKQRKVKTLSIVALIVAVLGLTVAFASLSQTLTINGTAKVETATWDIKFANLSAATKTGAAEVTTEPTLQDDSTALKTFAIKLTKPGDSVTYTFDVKNSGTIDAIITGIVPETIKPVCTGVSATNAEADAKIICDGLTYSLTYTDDGKAVAKNDTLAAGETKNLTLKLAFESDSLPTDDVNISGLDIALTYGQN